MAAPGIPEGSSPAAARTAQELAETRTTLALRRSFLAAERTLMAWVRTALSMISFGFTMVKFFEYLDQSRGPTVGIFGRTWAPATIGLGLMTLGLFALLAAVLQHRQTLAVLHEEGLERSRSLALTVAAILALLGLLAMASILSGD
jgi:putative membrane protein